MHMLDGNHLGALAVLIEDRLGRAFGDLSQSACALLLTLRHWQPLAISEIASIINVSQPTVTRVADGLVRAGLIERGPKQGRRVCLALTATGSARARRLANEREHVLAGLLETLDDRSRAELDRLVSLVLGAATGSRQEARTLCRFCDHTVCDGPKCPVGAKARAIEAGSSAGHGPNIGETPS
jgi:DNA-binding MarR family transcriptional regulator